MKNQNYYVDLISKYFIGAQKEGLIIPTENLLKLAEELSGQIEPRVMPKIAEEVIFILNINGIPRTTTEQFITGEGLKKLANSPQNYGVWLMGEASDTEIADNEQIDLNQPCRDKFITGSKYTTEG